MERLEQYCRDHGWEITCIMYGGPKLVLSKGKCEISSYLEIGMDIDFMIREMEFLDSYPACTETQLEFAF